jgi:hypothetical protein
MLSLTVDSTANESPSQWNQPRCSSILIGFFCRFIDFAKIPTSWLTTSSPPTVALSHHQPQRIARVKTHPLAFGFAEPP